MGFISHGVIYKTRYSALRHDAEVQKLMAVGKHLKKFSRCVTMATEMLYGASLPNKIEHEKWE